MTNPLLADWSTPFELPPYPQISDDDFLPAFEHALAQAEASVKAIAANPAPPSFENTIDALELCDEPLNKVLGVFYTLAGADTNPARESLQRDFAPRLSAYSTSVMMNQDLFGRVDALWTQRDDLGLSGEQARVLYLTHRAFLRAGVALAPAARARMKEIKARLAVLGTNFSQNLLADERDWTMTLSDSDLTGLPDFVRGALIAAGRERAASGPVVTLSRSHIVPFLQFSPRRDLRERAYRAWGARGAGGGAHDNLEIVAETLALRQEQAALLGYDTYSAFKLETEMAKTPARVRDLLMQVWEPARAAAEGDAVLLAEMMQIDGINGPLQPWDWHYYSEKRRRRDHDLDEAALKPYLQLERMIEAAFDCAGRLFGLSFAPLDVALYHPDARAWEVTRDGQHVAVFIGDYFARASKRSGAWCSASRSQRKLGGAVTPVVHNVCNFVKPEPGAPALLSYDDARTLFHEFGHALHQMLSDVTYGSVSGTSVSRDFVELPSQLFEHWLEVPEVLDRFATHADTGAPMPADMRDRLLAARTYDMGFQTVEYVASALVDLDFHTRPAPADPMARQGEILADIGMPAAIGMRHATPHFAHVFSSDYYASAYYSYMWSEVMDADAFAAFEEAGDAFDADQARALERHILSKGGTDDPETLYTAFRGRLPGIQALLKGRGFAPAG